MVGLYTSEELKTNFQNEGEQERVQGILNNLFQRAAAGIVLSEYEKEFVCMFLKIATGDAPPFDVAQVCASFNFITAYLIYGMDLTGGSKYYRPSGFEIIEISIEEAQANLQYLADEAVQWQAKLYDKSDKDALITAARHEYEFELKHVQKNSAEYKSKFQFGGTHIYKYAVMSTLLHNKFIYLTAKTVFENFDDQDLTLILNGKNIIISESSLIHIVSRHYAEGVKKYRSKKSFHTGDFYPKIINKKLKEIFQMIEQAGGLKADTVTELNFQYKGSIYRVYTSDRPDTTGDIFLSTFFIVEDPNILQRLANEYDLIQIDNDLAVYQPS